MTTDSPLAALVLGARSVLFDFDGPICGLFARHRAPAVAARLIDWLDARGQGDALPEELRRLDDPHAVLRAVGRRCPGDDVVTALEEQLTLEEVEAAGNAAPTRYADELVRAWAGAGVPLAVATNNSVSAVVRYLESRGIDGCFGPHLHGRTPDPSLLKPEPDCLHRALDSLGCRPEEALMIGDTPSDLWAAEKAGVAFIGYGRDARRGERLSRAGATAVVPSLKPLLSLLSGRHC
ncbi:HAD family hydrolase [Streptomyces sp. NPDC059909]|uniref:HAD family hydrolase n=1 Tax=Streptomyces sp. NPDC059909 TaxID=3346998 RepID=UPI0036564395